MGTISNALSSGNSSLFDTTVNTSGTNSGSTTGTDGSTMFTGGSAYSQDLQAAVTRAVAIASLPIQLLNSQKTALSSQASDLSDIDSAFAKLQTAVQGLTSAMSGSSYQADVSNPDLVSVGLTNGAMEGNYSIEIDDIGAYATSMSTATWDPTPSPLGGPTTYTLQIGDDSQTFTPTDNSATSVASAINARFGGQIQASVVNVGPNSAPDNRISLKSATLGPVNLDILNSSGTSLQSQQQPPGRLASYIVDGSGLAVTSATRVVSISPGLTLNLTGSDPAHPVNITVTRSTSALDSALTSFADAYNATVDVLNKQHGGGGALQGDAMISNLSRSLGGLATYSGSSGPIGGLASLGLDLGLDGKLTYNSFTLMAADIGNPSSVTAFLGSPTGGGFLQAATNALNSIEDPKTGMLKNAESDVQSQITSLTTNIAQKQDKVNQMQVQLQSQMAAADALIATMQQQYSYISQMFQAMQTADQMYK